MKKVLFVAIAFSSAVFTVMTIWDFAKFVSDFSSERHEIVVEIKRNKSQVLKTPDAQKEQRFYSITLWVLLWDMLLLLLFMIGHTVLAAPGIKRGFDRFDLLVIQRSVYNAVTSWSLKVLISNWSTAFYYPLWVVDIKTNTVCWWIFGIIQCLSWFVIYSGCVMMDFAELLGVRQVYYYIRGFDDPMSYKSPELQRLYSHMRHPSFVGFCAAFWFFPYMTLDRLLLSLILTTYMLMAFKVDRIDHVYQREQRVQKVYEMSHATTYSRTYQ